MTYPRQACNYREVRVTERTEAVFLSNLNIKMSACAGVRSLTDACMYVRIASVGPDQHSELGARQLVGAWLHLSCAGGGYTRRETRTENLKCTRGLSSEKSHVRIRSESSPRFIRRKCLVPSIALFDAPMLKVLLLGPAFGTTCWSRTGLCGKHKIFYYARWYIKRSHISYTSNSVEYCEILISRQKKLKRAPLNFTIETNHSS